ncbi:MAG: hypothetical protein HY301_02755 [Verrucomicrobia bacterium]|nr:hypothetical protein [Verrucomicrobiota bacterium]
MTNSDELLNVDGLTAPGPVLDTNTANLMRHALGLNPVKQNGTATVALGAPTAGTFVLNQLWWDAYGAAWRCISAGTPGTWKQITAAILSTAPVTSGVPTGYLVLRGDQNFRAYTWNGTAWVLAALAEYAFADVPDATDNAGALISVPDGDDGNPCLAFATGGNWLRIVLGTAISD